MRTFIPYDMDLSRLPVGLCVVVGRGGAGAPAVGLWQASKGGARGFPVGLKRASEIAETTAYPRFSFPEPKTFRLL